MGVSLHHLYDIFTEGFLPYRGAPLFFNAFWTSLAFVDLAVPLFLAVGRFRLAIVSAVGIMTLDVCINTFFAFKYRDSVYPGNIDLVAQTAFFLFVIVSAPLAWRWAVSGRQNVG
ncbi:hypothetical protein CA13_10640 [Planctomycetes bacterium CA13]|uniref:Uncharacterized protein n=1 Tax=Novipirellula herctigrandis TaxID=2527986 RepID=A0A5C5YX76_9BACT|nr:hypothetical protein CA13_10640 [Planctomycetes bacterium CA13]